jgi:serine/threonine protein kinase
MKLSAIACRSLCVFPPFMALVRGVTLKEWLNNLQNAPTILGMAVDVLELLARLHDSGYVHRDLKPDNILYEIHTHRWRLLDFGIAETTGTETNLVQADRFQTKACRCEAPIAAADIAESDASVILRWGLKR